MNVKGQVLSNCSKWILLTLAPYLALPAFSTAQFSGLVLTEEFENLELRACLQRIDDHYPVDLYYRPGQIPGQRVNIRFDGAPLETVLTTLLSPAGLDFVPFSHFAVIIAPRPDILQLRERRGSIQPAPEIEAIVAAPGEEIIRIGEASSPTNQATALVSGTVTDQRSGEPLAGATLQFKNTSHSLITDASGSFQLRLPPGNYRAEVSYLGFETFDRQVQVFDSGEWSIALIPMSQELETVVVEGRAADANVSSAQIGLEQLSIIQIKELPSFLGEIDVIKSLLTLPGVSTVGEGASGFNVRGGSIDQNLILQDGALLINPSHVFGFYSSLNPDVIRSVNLFKGNIPAQYGGRISSVLDMEVRDADNTTFGLQGGIGLVSSRLTADLPLVKEKTSLLLAGRISYTDWMMRRVKDPDVKASSARFYDINAKLTHRLEGKGNITLGYYQSFDEFQFSDDFGYGWKNKIASFKWTQILVPRLSIGLSGAWGSLDNLQFQPSLLNAFDLTNGLHYYKLNPDFFLGLRRHSLHFGVDWIRYLSKVEQLSPRGPGSNIINRQVEKDNGEVFGVYINDEMSLGNRLNLSVGLRYSLFQQLGPARVFQYADGGLRDPEQIIDSTVFSKNEVVQRYSNFEPRVSLSYRLGPDNSIKLSYNRLGQYIHLISNTTVATPTDIWQVSTPNLPAQVADNFSIGYFQNFQRARWETSFELYYRSIDNLVEYKDLVQLFLNDNVETALLIGQGRAYGIELSIKRRQGDLTGWLSYTYARTLRKVAGSSRDYTLNNGNWFASGFDQPHNVKLTLNYDFNKRQKLGVNFVFSSGRPVTLPVSNYTLNELVVPHFSDRNQFRIPDYHRLDLSYTINRNAVRTKRLKGSLSFSVYNVYFRKNPFSIFFRQDFGRRVKPFRLAVIGSAIPAVTYNFKL